MANHVFVPLSGSQDARGEYTQCAVGTGMLSCPYPPAEHPAAPAPQPDEEPPTVLYAPLGYGTATAYVLRVAYDTLTADLAASRAEAQTLEAELAEARSDLMGYQCLSTYDIGHANGQESARRDLAASRAEAVALRAAGDTLAVALGRLLESAKSFDDEGGFDSPDYSAAEMWRLAKESHDMWKAALAALGQEALEQKVWAAITLRMTCRCMVSEVGGAPRCAVSCKACGVNVSAVTGTVDACDLCGHYSCACRDPSGALAALGQEVPASRRYRRALPEHLQGWHAAPETGQEEADG